MVIKTLVKLDKVTIEKLKAMCRVQLFATPTPLFYQGHVPMVAYLVIDGSVNLLKNKKIKSTVQAGGVIGVKELLEKTPSTVTAETAPNSSVCYLDKSTVQDLMKKDNSELSSFLQNLLEHQVSLHLKFTVPIAMKKSLSRFSMKRILIAGNRFVATVALPFTILFMPRALIIITK